MDWEDISKFAFWQLVQTWLIKSELDAMSCVRILHEAQRCKKTTLPMDLVRAVEGFIAWQVEGKERPAWVSNAIGPGIA